MYLEALVFSSIALLVQEYADYYLRIDKDKAIKEMEDDFAFPKVLSYDYIIVGGGTAGCILAGRLSEDYNVLLLEKGGDPPPPTYTYRAYGHYARHPAIHDFYYSVPQPNISLENDGILTVFNGRMLGGSGSHNANVYNRGSPKDYDRIAEVLNDPSWKYENMLKYFKRLETYVGPFVDNTTNSEELYGNNGPIHVETAWEEPMLQKWLAAGKELGYKAGDPNGYQTESFTPLAFSTKGGVRQGGYTSYVKPIEGSRTTLRVLRYSNVEKILINETTHEAYGVVYLRHGIPQISLAEKAVIISAGVVGSPLLLMKSGIGPNATLNSAGIPTVSQSPGVGSNFQDHVGFTIDFETKNPFWTLPLEMVKDLLSFHSDPRGGDLTKPTKVVQALISSERAKADGEGDWPDIQLELGAIQFDTLRANNTVFMNIVANRLKSMGTIDLNSTAYLEGEREDTKLAILDFNYFQDESDLSLLVDGIELALRLTEETNALNSTDLSFIRIPEEIDVCGRIHPFRSRPYWTCYVQQRARWWFHLTGTCKMGRQDDSMAVVDTTFSVVGMKKLKVVDASVLPFPTNANINAAVMALAEKAVDAIREETTGPSSPTNPSINGANKGQPLDGMTIAILLASLNFIMYYYPHE